MKIEMSERLKHRLTGLVVVISIAIIFLPAMMKKSNRRFEETVHVAVVLPHKPQISSAAIPGKKALFQSVKVAHVEIPAMPKAPIKIANAQPIKNVTPKVVIEPVGPSQLAKLEVETPAPKVEPRKLSIPKLPPAKIVKAAPATVAAKNAHYGVQLASFSQQINAQQLVTKLRQHGYTASYTPIHGNKGQSIYKVVVGAVAQRDAALSLQKKLASNMKLSGFIVKMA